MLDEPTNDLDLETLDLLQEMLGEYAGTLILVSHDRDFLDRIVTSVIVAEGEGRWAEYAGGYSDMITQRGAGVEAPVKQAKQKNQNSGRATNQTANEKRKLSFKEKYALETLPKEMDALRDQITALETKLAVPDFYSRDPRAFEQASQDLSALEQRLAGVEDEWLELELLREAFEKA